MSETDLLVEIGLVFDVGGVRGLESRISPVWGHFEQVSVVVEEVDALELFDSDWASAERVTVVLTNELSD